MKYEREMVILQNCLLKRENKEFHLITLPQQGNQSNIFNYQTPIKALTDSFPRTW